jgi:hypothetical protein
MPDNAIFYQAAYIAAAIVYGAYTVSLVIRMRRASERRRRQERNSGLPGQSAHGS